MAPSARSEATRQLLLETSLDLFARNGYEATSVDTICRKAGLSKGAFYHHFTGKQELFLALLDQWLSGIDLQLDAIRAEAPTTAAALRAMADTARAIFAVARGRLPMFLEFWTQAQHNRTVWKATVEPYRRYQAYFAELVREGTKDGSLRRVNPENASRLLVSTAVGWLLQSVLDPEGADWGGVPAAGVDLLLKGLEPPPA
jgi:AcrR family transcriptional regulator